MTQVTLPHRLARRDDLDALRALMDAAISELQKPFLKNWLRVLGTAELPHIDQGVRQ